MAEQMTELQLMFQEKTIQELPGLVMKILIRMDTW